MASPHARPRDSSDSAPSEKLGAHPPRFPGLPPGAELGWLSIDGESLAILSYPVSATHASAVLTASERDVVGHVAAGRSNQEIARRRGTSARTIANQLGRVFLKLGVRSRRELAALVMGSKGDRGDAHD